MASIEIPIYLKPLTGLRYLIIVFVICQINDLKSITFCLLPSEMIYFSISLLVLCEIHLPVLSTDSTAAGCLRRKAVSEVPAVNLSRFVEIIHAKISVSSLSTRGSLWDILHVS